MCSKNEYGDPFIFLKKTTISVLSSYIFYFNILMFRILDIILTQSNKTKDDGRF